MGRTWWRPCQNGSDFAYSAPGSAHERKAIKDEVLKLGGKEIPTEGPRVFLVDLGAEKMTYTPLKGEKLDLLPRHLEKGGYENGVLETIEKLKKASPEVKKFLE